MISNSGYSEKNVEPHGYESNDDFLIVNCCGNDKFSNTNYWQRRVHGRKDYYLIYVKSGYLFCTIEDNPYKAKEGQAILIKPLESHKIYYSDKIFQEVFWVHFTGYGVPTLLQKLNLIESKVFWVGNYLSIDDLFFNIIRELQTHRPSYIPLCTGYLMELLSNFSRRIKEGHLNTAVSELHDTIVYLNENYQQHHSTKELANRCNLSPYYFIRKFKKATGYSPGQYLMNIRMSKAKKLLIESNLPIGDIAYMIGYKNPLYFSKCFKTFYGVSPSNYKKKACDNNFL